MQTLRELTIWTGKKENKNQAELWKYGEAQSWMVKKLKHCNITIFSENISLTEFLPKWIRFQK